MKITQWLAAGLMIGMAGAASATPAYGVISGANLSLMTTTAAGPAPKLLIIDDPETPCPAAGGLDLGDVNSALTKHTLSILLTARRVNASVAVGFDDETCVVHTIQMAPATP